MTTIGMLHHRLNPETVIKSYAFAAVAKAEGVDFFYFTPKRVDFQTRTIQGKVLEEGKWQDKTMPFPDVIYNAGSPEKLAISKTIINRLRKEIPFTTNSIGNKWNVTRRLKEAKVFAKYLIPSEVVTNVEKFRNFMTTYKKIVFKPVEGRKGKGIYFISKVGTGYDIQQDTKIERYTSAQLEAFLTERLAEESYIVQPYIQSTMKSGQVFDFRVHVQKNGDGKWVITTVYPRIAPSGSIIPNINNGGYTNYLEPFLALEFKEEAFNMNRMLEHFGLSLARHLDDIQMSKFGEVIDEIGIDVGVDEHQKIWVYEVNWRPGCPPAFYLELDVVKHTIQYAVYIAHHQDEINEQIRLAKTKNTPEINRNKPIIAITGSAGKTTTKAFLASILSKKWNVFQSKDYWNTTEHTKQHKELITDAHEAVVLEYGMAYPGVITEHCRIIQPKISVVTNIGLAHVGNFDGDIKGVAHAKSELIHGMDQQGLLVINQDDDNSKLLEIKQFKGKIITVGIHKPADYQAYDVRYVEDGMKFKMKLQNEEIELYIPILGEHHVYNALNAIAVADQLGFTPNEIQAGVQFKKPPRRLTLYHCRNNITLIDDTVHSHPQGARAAIDVLAAISKKRKIAIIGQMRELGDLREEEYRKLGEYIADKKIDVLITYGFRTEEIGQAAKNKGFPATHIHHFINKDYLHELLDKLVKSGDTILVKGASKTNMFETIKYLDERFKV
ncbi:UDP-N-acetylmuramoyl-tripeptide--D-alanyl-D-alanine ligase [Lysinibacillus sp. 2017]|uniref:YheC/YheD family protein n=1 Tax=unclassified Lysinibacillus TaxID=2636778 RepID=UPI000D527964|nr:MULTISPECIES: YheC/YheD family protein [unclassified Lysinibacillus]AWE07535.1 UDP-N-acetylmuramoyl-tripeptide--D-alanyl-D-alanine ligase [Lysinibacillus sp. 2017]TGN36698.1 UDP-N-acetylmuramoyl-tripeptide--D-alanyl-D-alanine ligase [Lysinibacillus sp. S2017]